MLKKGDKRGTFLTKLQQRQIQMKERMQDNLEEGEEFNPMKIPKDWCPVCFQIHPSEIPDLCWKSGLKTTSESLQRDFENYVKNNKKGRIV